MDSATSWLGDLEQVTFPSVSLCSCKRESHRHLSGFLLGVVRDCRRESVLRTIKRLHLEVFMFISLCLASMRIKSAKALGSVALAPVGLCLFTSRRRG